MQKIFKRKLKKKKTHKKSQCDPTLAVTKQKLKKDFKNHLIKKKKKIYSRNFFFFWIKIRFPVFPSKSEKWAGPSVEKSGRGLLTRNPKQKNPQNKQKKTVDELTNVAQRSPLVPRIKLKNRKITEVLQQTFFPLSN